MLVAQMFPPGAPRREDEISRMTAALARIRSAEVQVSRGDAGVVAVLGAQPADGSIHEDDDVLVCLTGDVLWADPLIVPSWPPSAGRDRGAGVIARAWRLHGPDCLAHVDGAFAVVLHDRRQGVWFLGTDRFASIPLSYGVADGALLASTHLAALASVPALAMTENEPSIFEFLAFGYVVGDKTHLEGVRRVPPGGSVTFGADGVTVRRWFVPAWKPDGSRASAREQAEELTPLLRRVVARHARGHSKMGLLLSGGHDSRVLLTAALAQGVPLTTLTFGAEDSRDAVLAQKLAAATGVAHRIVPLTPRDVVSFAPFAVLATDGMFNLFHAHGVSVMEELSREVGAVLNGITALHGMHTAAQVKRLGEGFRGEPHHGFLIGDLMGVEMPDGSTFGSVFANGTDELVRPELIERFGAALQAATHEFLGDETSLSTWDRTERAYLHQRLVRFTVNGPNMARPLVAVRAPLLDVEFLDYCFKLPPSLRGLDKEIIAQVIRQLSPDAANVPLAATGRPAGLSPTLDMVYRLGNRARRGVDSVMQSLGLSEQRAAVPYADYETWLRRPGPLRGMIDDLLMSGSPWITRWFDPVIVRGIVDAQRLGWNGAELVGRLLTLELFGRTLRSAAAEPAVASAAGITAGTGGQ